MPLLRAVAMDGPAGAGKSTIATNVAQALGFVYVDTGAMYRAVALGAARAGVDMKDEDAMVRVARESSIVFENGGKRIRLDGEDVSSAIRSPEVTANTRYAARVPLVRETLMQQQRDFASRAPVVMEGRDITTVVLPDARWKFFLTASCEERARRRLDEMRAAGHDAEFEDILDQIRQRDEADNQVGPLKRAREIAERGDGEIRGVDTTSLTPDEVVDAIVSEVRKSGDSA